MIIRAGRSGHEVRRFKATAAALVVVVVALLGIGLVARAAVSAGTTDHTLAPPTIDARDTGSSAISVRSTPAWEFSASVAYSYDDASNNAFTRLARTRHLPTTSATARAEREATSRAGPSPGPPVVAAEGEAGASSARFVVNSEGVATDLGPRLSTAERPVVIGEGMEARVVPAAQQLGADWYQAPELANEAQSEAYNRYWINEQMNQGRGIIDTGPASGRADFPEPTSPYFSMERGQIMARSYPYHSQYPWDW